MSNVGQPERAMQSRVDALFRDGLGYGYLGDWTERDGSCNIEDSLLTGWLRPEDLEHWRILRRKWRSWQRVPMRTTWVPSRPGRPTTDEHEAS